MYILWRTWHTWHRCNTNESATIEQYLHSTIFTQQMTVMLWPTGKSHIRESGEGCTASHWKAIVTFTFLYSMLNQDSPLVNICWFFVSHFRLRVVCGARNRRDCEKIPARVELRRSLTLMSRNCNCVRAWKDNRCHKSNKNGRTRELVKLWHQRGTFQLVTLVRHFESERYPC